MTNIIRPTFYLDNNKNQPIKAGGALIYRVNNKLKDIELLLIKNRGRYEDFGGRTDIKDKTILDTVCREIDEESNNIFRKKPLKKIFTKCNYIYSTWSKYVIYMYELSTTNEYYNIDPIIFGNRETHDNIERTVQWIPYSIYKSNEFQKEVNFRLKIKELNMELENIYNSHFKQHSPKKKSKEHEQQIEEKIIFEYDDRDLCYFDE